MKILQFFLIQLFGLIFVIPTVVPSSTDDIVPVLLWGGDGPGELHSNPFEKISQSYLEEVLNKKLGKLQPPVLVFIKDQFCIEDLKQHSESLGQLKGYGSIHYIPGVTSPVSTFKMLPNYNQSMEEKFESISDGQIVITEITDLDSIPEIFDFSKKSSPNLVGALTGNDCVYRSNRGKREVDMDLNNKEFLIKTPKLLLYADSVPLLTINNTIHESINLADYKYNASDKGNGTNKSSFIVTVEFYSMNESLPSNVIFDIEIIYNSGYYSLKKINISIDSKYDASLEIRPTLLWATGFSYHCTQKTIFRSPVFNANLTFKNLQLQVDTDKFGDTYDCIGFTSEPIWSSMFVTALVILITLWGILMIMDIRTMERFDDPKGKTISVTATE